MAKIRDIIAFHGPAAGLPSDLEEGEIAFTTDTHKFYVGDGTTNPVLIGPLPSLRGFTNRTDSILAWDAGNTKVTLAVLAPATSYSFYENGILYTKTTTQECVLDNMDAGVHFVYFSGGTLVDSTDWPGFTVPLVAFVYTDGTNCIGLADERHQYIMDSSTHGYLHSTVGTRYASGLTATRLTTGTGGADNDCKISVSSGHVWDEDIDCNIVSDDTPTAPFEQILGSTTTVPAQLPIYYRNGANGTWLKVAPTTYVAYPSDGTGGPTVPIGYNRYNAGSWGVAAVTDSYYTASWVVASNNQDYPVFIVMGQRQDQKLADAQTNNTWELLSFPTANFKEFKVLYRLLIRCDSSYSNAINGYVASVQDLRSVSNLPSGTYVATAHGILTGLTDTNAHPASSISVSAAGFSGNLSATDTDVQTALATIDGMAISIPDTVQFDSDPGSDHTATGIIAPFTAHETVAFGDAVYINADGEAAKADMNATTTMPCIGLIVTGGNASDTVTVLTHGYARDASWAWTVGGSAGIVYVGAAGALTQTAPSGTGDQVQVVGVAIAATRIFVNPSLVLVEVA